MKKIFLLLFAMCIVIINLSAQQNNAIKQRPVMEIVKNPIGSEYYICFMKNYQDLLSPPNPIQLKLFITAINEVANVRVEIPSIKYSLDIKIPKNITQQVIIPKEAQILKNNEVLNGAAIHVVSDSPIFLYGLNTRNQTSDTYLAFPVSTLGTRYRVMSFTTADVRLRDLAKPEFAITSPYDKTNLKIISTDNFLKTGKNLDTLKITMNRGDVYQLSSKSTKDLPDSSKKQNADLTGTLILSDKPIAVFGGHECAFVPLGMPDNTCNHLVEQMPPTSSWGKHFFIGKLAKRTTYQIRVLADKDSTNIFFNNKNKVKLNAGQFFDVRTDLDMVISSDKPILVAQYSEGFRNGDNIGDPMMLLIPPTNQFLSSYYFSTPKDGSWNHFINVIVPTTSVKNLLVDSLQPIFMDTLYRNKVVYYTPQPITGHISNKNIDKFKLVYRQLGLSNYSLATIQVPYGPHLITCTKPFGMYSYGFGFGDDAYDAYGTMGGQTFQEFEFAPDKEPPYVKSGFEEDAINVVIHEDRENDSGIMSLDIKEITNIDFEPYSVPIGIAQLKIRAFALDRNKAGRAIFSVKDVAGNEELYTICYVYNTDADKYVFEFNKSSLMQCNVNEKYAGIFGRLAQTYNIVDFKNVGNVKSYGGGSFKNKVSLNGIGGAYFSYRFKPMLNFTGKLYFENLNANLIAPWDSLTNIFNPKTGRIDKIQEMDRLELSSIFVNLSLGAEWYFERRLYLLGGINISTHLTDNVKHYTDIADPSYEYNKAQIYDGPSKMFNSFGTSLFAGAGFTSTLPIYNRYTSFFIEITYNYGLTNMIKNDLWKINQIAFNFGLKYNF